MKRMSGIIIDLCAMLIAVIALTGCAAQPVVTGPEAQESTSSSLRQETITLSDGRTVTCVVYSSGYAGGLSCDFDVVE